MHARCQSLFALLGIAASAQAPSPPAAATERVEGRVVDLRGEPLVAAAMVVTDDRDPETVLARGATDGEGWFVIARVPPRDSWRITATAAEHCGAFTWATPGRGPVVVRLPESVRVTGRVFDRDGKGVAGATVMATLAHTRQFGGVRDLAVTDADGRFELKNAPLGLTSIAAVIPGVGLGLQWRHLTADATVDLPPPSSPSMDATFEFVGLPDGVVPAGSIVELSTPNSLLRRLPPPWDRVRLTDGKGVTIANLPTATLRVAPSVPGFLCQPPVAELRPDLRQLKFQLTAVEAASAQWTGTLRDADGKPCGRTGLEVRDTEHGLRATTVTDAAGNWRLASTIPAGKAAVFRTLPGDLVLDVEGPHVAANPQFAKEYRCVSPPAMPLELRAIRGAVVTGSVVGADGAPAAHAVVAIETFHQRRKPEWATYEWTTTDRQGVFTLRGVHPVPGSVRLAVTGPLGHATSPEFPLDSPAMKVDLEPLRLSPPATVEGEVRDAAGAPVAGARVWLREWDSARKHQLSGLLSETYTDRSGRFRFLGARPGAAVLQPSLDTDVPPPLTQAPVDPPPFEVEAGKVVTVPMTWTRR